MTPPRPGAARFSRCLTEENTLAKLAPYYADDTVELYHADCRDLLPRLAADLIVTDPPYEQTSLRWDRWPTGWLDAAAGCASALWCFLPLRQFAMPPYRGREFAAAGWRLSQDLEPTHDSAADQLTWENTTVPRLRPTGSAGSTKP